MRKRQRKKNITKQRPMPEDPKELAEAIVQQFLFDGEDTLTTETAIDHFPNSETVSSTVREILRLKEEIITLKAQLGIN